MLSWAEIFVVLLVILASAAGAAGLVLVVVFFANRTRRTSTSKGGSTTTQRLPVCSRCGTTMPADALQGLCPRCVLQVGIGTNDGASPAFQDASGKPNPPAVADLEKYFPQLEILELLGQGGMGAVYKARQRDLDRFVALKVLPGGAGSDPAFAERFMREARALARLDHPNIVAVHDFGQVRYGASKDARAGGGSGAPAAGETPALLYYFVMEYIDGPNLRQLMHREKLSPQEALTIVPKICEALQFAHDEGIVHRDIKPENILIDSKGRVKIADFGIAKITGKQGDISLTGAKDVIGTPHYMAPEQVERPTTVDHRADIYSLGVVFYEMLTGELPLGKFDVPSRKVEVDVRLDDVVLRSLAKDPERRYQQANQVQTEVETIAADPAAGGRGAGAAHLEMSGTASHALTGANPYNPWETTTIVVGTFILVVLFSLGFTVSGPFKIPMLVIAGIGLVIAGVSLAGLWPFPSPFFAESTFSSRNLRRHRSDSASRTGHSARGCFFVTGTLFLIGMGAVILVAVGMTIFAIAWPALRAHQARPHAEEAAQAVNGRVEFGPVTALSLTAMTQPDGAIHLDLDTGAVVVPPRRLAEWSEKRQWDWIREEGIDLWLSRSMANSAPFYSLATPNPSATRLVRVSDALWEEASLSVVETSLGAGAAGVRMESTEDLTLYWLGNDPDRPLTFVFRTAAGTRGLLQLTDVDLEAEQLVFRMKKVSQRPSPVEGTPSPISPAVASSAPDVVTVGGGADAQFGSVQAAIDAVADGGTVRIGAGRFPEELRINRPVRLVGEGWETTIIGPTNARTAPSPERLEEMQRRIVEAASREEQKRLQAEALAELAPPIVRIEGTTDVALQDLQVTQPVHASRTGLPGSPLLMATDAELILSRAAIIGSSEDCLVLNGRTQCDIDRTLVAAAWRRGIVVDGRSRLFVHDSDIRNCRYAGIVIARHAEVRVEKCRISGAAWHGIRYDNVSPLIENNLIFGNARSGIYASGVTQGRVRGNVFFDNEMNGMSCWFENRDVIEGNTFANNHREALSILGGSEPTIRNNIFASHPVALYQGRVQGESASTPLGQPLIQSNQFWHNPTNWIRVEQQDSAGIWIPEPTDLSESTASCFIDPVFAEPDQSDYGLSRSSSARRDGVGVADPLPVASPWPLQPAEKAIIPDGDSRDSRLWKPPGD